MLCCMPVESCRVLMKDRPECEAHALHSCYAVDHTAQQGTEPWGEPAPGHCHDGSYTGPEDPALVNRHRHTARGGTEKGSVGHKQD